jgi:hypothetical protein
MPLGASARTALQVGNRILSAAALANDGLTPRQRSNKRNYLYRKKKQRSRVLFQGTQPQSSSSELSGEFDGSNTMEVTQARALGHAPPSLSSSEEDPLDVDEAHLQAAHHVEMRRQLLHQAHALRKEQEVREEEEQNRIDGQNVFGSYMDVTREHTSGCPICSVTLLKTLVTSLHEVAENSSCIHSIPLVILHLIGILYGPQKCILFTIGHRSRIKQNCLGGILASPFLVPL